jgi:hypothetical protein
VNGKSSESLHDMISVYQRYRLEVAVSFEEDERSSPMYRRGSQWLFVSLSAQKGALNPVRGYAWSRPGLVFEIQRRPC